MAIMRSLKTELLPGEAPATASALPAPATPNPEAAPATTPKQVTIRFTVPETIRDLWRKKAGAVPLADYITSCVMAAKDSGYPSVR